MSPSKLPLLCIFGKGPFRSYACRLLCNLNLNVSSYSESNFRLGLHVLCFVIFNWNLMDNVACRHWNEFGV